MATPEENLKKAMDLLNRAAARLCDGPGPDPTWWREWFCLTGAHMILTDEGWESGEGKAEYLAQWDGSPDDNPIYDEVNTPIGEPVREGSEEGRS